MDYKEKLRIAYKKLKSNVFYDKYLLPLRDQLVLYESQIESKLAELESALFYGAGWEEKEKQILESIDVLVYPKKLKPVDEDLAIFNSDSMPITLEKPQYFIELSPEGHILGALWVLEFGVKLDQNAGETTDTYEGMYPHSYGNRLKKNLINKETNTYTYAPGLFEPYFSQYQSWRDHALDYAKERLNDKQDALILTLDFKSFYYSVDIQKPVFDGFLSLFNEIAERNTAWLDRLNHFVYRVIERYSQRLRSVHIDDEETLKLGERNVLPIGFLPSNILSNVVLTAFDKAVIQKWNPIYYGRYVDDIIIVDKVETNSEVYRLARATEPKKRLTADGLMKRFLCDTGVLKRERKTKNNKAHYLYRISKDTLDCGDSDVTIQDQKVKMFYFQSGATKALLTCFQSKIWDNVSEFRLLPDLDTIIKHRDYSEIFQLKNEDSINKLRSVTGIELDKFALSKFLGKYRKVGGLIESREEDAFSEDALMIFDERTLIENYTAWERLLEIFIVNHRLDIVEKLALRIISAIDRYTVPEGMCAANTATHKALVDTFHAALCRTLALVWGEECSRLINRVYDKIQNTLTDAGEKAVRYAPNSVLMFAPNQMNTARKAYCRTRMVNKYVLPLAIDCVDILQLSDAENIELCSLTSIRQLIIECWYERPTQYRYYPYMFLPQDISFAMVYEAIFTGKDLPQPDELVKQVREAFIRLNYPLTDENRSVFELDNIKSGSIDGFLAQSNEKRNYFATYVDCGKGANKSKLRVAIGNAALKVDDFHAVLDGKPNRSYLRYSDLRSMIDTAIIEKVDLLVLPESYVPLEWIPILSRVCANNQLALVTGVEHTVVPVAGVSKGGVYNLTAIILPYDKNGNSFSHVAFHHKVEYSPKELEIIKGYRYTPKMGKTYQLFCWKDVWFPVYCCYELTSIRDRSVFQTYADLVVAVEWNQDVPYFGNIVESLVRDLHCYCIQANSSDYGDSRVMRPVDTIRRDVIKTKGGQNTCILWEEIDIKALRDFQVKSLEMQDIDKSFKQTPPDFDQDILAKKRNGTLKDLIKDTVGK